MKKIFLIIIFCLTSCTKDNLPEFNKLDGLRILAFQTVTPEVNPGTAVTLTPIISDIGATTINYSAAGCVDPGISFGADPSCDGNPSKVTIAANVPLTLPGAGESWTGLANSFVVNVPNEAVIFSGRSAQEIFNGVSYLVQYTLTNDLGKSVTDVKRIIVSESAKTSKNANPFTSDIFANGVTMTSLSLSSILNLSTDLTLTSAENYIFKNAKLEPAALTEKLTTTWFVTDGETKFYRSSGVDSNEFTGPEQAPIGRSFYLLAVTRDDRGGLSFVKKKF